MKRVFLFSIVLMLSLFYSNTYAQFYDGDDKIYFYQRADNANYAYVFNFDGRKAACLNEYSTALYVKNKLEENQNYFEGQVYEVKYDMKYRDDLSSSSWTVYSQYHQGIYSLPSFTLFFYFSKDRKTMICKVSSSKNEDEYRLVDKDYYIDEGRRRPKTNNGVIYE